MGRVGARGWLLLQQVDLDVGAGRRRGLADGVGKAGELGLEVLLWVESPPTTIIEPLASSLSAANAVRSASSSSASRVTGSATLISRSNALSPW
jgi:hypothetical protein